MWIPLIIGIGGYLLLSDNEQDNLGLNAPKLSRDEKLKRIYEKFKDLEYNKDNYDIGGGRSDYLFASRRHVDAKNDKGKLTLGETAQLFKRATGLSVDEIKELIEFVFPRLEWHHAGKLPKKYGGGMRKVYFVNSEQIAELSKNFNKYLKEKEQKENDLRKKLNEKSKFLKKYTEYVSRVQEKPKYFFETKREMYGKYGWFNSEGKSYNLPEYYSGYKFRSRKKYEEFIKNYAYIY